ncbi:MAG TPA: hypothetical protein VJP06_02260, partial [Thermoplasmata archaeon]|nr:hypothetical protein [Thermoplasmata archaeon]
FSIAKDFQGAFGRAWRLGLPMILLGLFVLVGGQVLVRLTSGGANGFASFIVALGLSVTVAGLMVLLIAFVIREGRR